MKQNLSFYQLLYGETELYSLQQNQKAEAKPKSVVASEIQTVNEPPHTEKQVKEPAKAHAVTTYPHAPVCVVTDLLSAENQEQVERMFAALKFEPKMIVHRQMISFDKPVLISVAQAAKAKYLLVFTDQPPEEEQLTAKYAPFQWDDFIVARFDGFENIRTSADIKKKVWAAVNQINFKN
jgi:hypothetical protein